MTFRMSNILQNVVSGTQAAANEMQCSSINSCHDKEKLSNKILYTSRGGKASKSIWVAGGGRPHRDLFHNPSTFCAAGRRHVINRLVILMTSLVIALPRYVDTANE